MLQDVLLPGQTHKNTVNYSVSAFETRWKPSRTTNKVKPKNGQIGGVFVFFEHSRSKKLRKDRVFLTPRKPKTTVFAVFFAPGTKNHGIYSVLWPEPSKNSGIYAVFSMLQDVLLPGQTHKNTVNYSVLAFETRWKPSKTTNKCPKWSISFGPKKPGKRQVGFWALPPQAPASPFKNGPISGLPPTPPRLASLRFAYTYTQAQAFGWLSWYSPFLYPTNIHLYPHVFSYHSTPRVRGLEGNNHRCHRLLHLGGETWLRQEQHASALQGDPVDVSVWKVHLCASRKRWECRTL